MELVSSGLSAPVASGPFDVGSAVAFAHQSLHTSDIKHALLGARLLVSDLWASARSFRGHGGDLL